MFKANAGLVQEGQDLFKIYAKELPDSIKNVRFYMTQVALSDLKVLKKWAEGFIKVGGLGELGDILTISRENKLNGEELRKLFFGRKMSGLNMITGQQWWIERSVDGKAIIREGDKSDTGKSWVEDNMICDQWNNFYEGLRDCWVIYRNPEATPENHDEYLGAPGYGIYPFSQVE